jgi:hypothetical protein
MDVPNPIFDCCSALDQLMGVPETGEQFGLANICRKTPENGLKFIGQ